MSPFEVVDDDANIFGDVTFYLESNNGDHESFQLFKLNRRQSELQLKNPVEEKMFSVSFFILKQLYLVSHPSLNNY